MRRDATGINKKVYLHKFSIKYKRPSDVAPCSRCDRLSEGGCQGKERDQFREIISHFKITYSVQSICDTDQVKM